LKGPIVLGGRAAGRGRGAGGGAGRGPREQRWDLPKGARKVHPSFLGVGGGETLKASEMPGAGPGGTRVGLRGMPPAQWAVFSFHRGGGRIFIKCSAPGGRAAGGEQATSKRVRGRRTNRRWGLAGRKMQWLREGGQVDSRDLDNERGGGRRGASGLLGRGKSGVGRWESKISRRRPFEGSRSDGFSAGSSDGTRQKWIVLWGPGGSRRKGWNDALLVFGRHKGRGFPVLAWGRRQSQAGDFNPRGPFRGAAGAPKGTGGAPQG